MKKIILIFILLTAHTAFADTKIFDEQDLLRAHKLGSAPSSVTMKFRSETERALKAVFLVDADTGNKLSATDVNRNSALAVFDRVPEGIWKISAVPAGKYSLIQIEIN